MVTAEAEPRAEIFEKMYVGLCFACVIFGLWKGWEETWRGNQERIIERGLFARECLKVHFLIYSIKSFFCVFCLYTFLFVGE